MTLFDKVTGSCTDYELLLLSWAEHHPYLFTLIKCFSPNLYIIMTVIGVQLIFKLMSSRKVRR